MSSNALIVWGGWDGHQPEEVAEVFRSLLVAEGFSVEVSNTLDSFRDEKNLQALDLIVPVWTMGKIDDEPLKAVCNAVAAGVGLAGCHGGMCDAFRDSPDWQFMTGGQWVAHPGNDSVNYSVHITDKTHPITEGMKDFEVRTEQYYMHVDPAVKVLANTKFPIADGPHVTNGPVEMPVSWTKLYGRGRVFYSAIGHTATTVEAEPHRTLLRRGCKWASKANAIKNGR